MSAEVFQIPVNENYIKIKEIIFWSRNYPEIVAMSEEAESVQGSGKSILFFDC